MADTAGAHPPAVLLDTYGADFDRWNNREAALAGREQLLRDRAFRHAWDAERRLDAALFATCTELDRDIEESGALQRLMRQTLAATRPASLAEFGWHRLAAAVLLAAALGGTFDLLFAQTPAGTATVVVGDNLLFGPDAVEL